MIRTDTTVQLVTVLKQSKHCTTSNSTTCMTKKHCTIGHCTFIVQLVTVLKSIVLVE